MRLPGRSPQAVYRVYAEEDFLAGKPDAVPVSAPRDRDLHGPSSAEAQDFADADAAPDAARGAGPVGDGPQPAGVDAFTDDEVAALLAALDGSTAGERPADEHSGTGARRLTSRWRPIAALVLMLVLAAGLPLVVVAGLRSATGARSQSPPPATVTYTGPHVASVVPASVDQRSRRSASVPVRRRPTGSVSPGGEAHRVAQARLAPTRALRKSDRAHEPAPSGAPPSVLPRTLATPQSPPPAPNAASAQPLPVPEARPGPAAVASHPRAPRRSSSQQFGFER